MSLHDAAKNGNLPQAEQALGNNEAINDPDGNKETALHKAARAGHVDMVNFLISKGAEIDAKDKYDRTALYLAAWNGHTAIAERLLEEDGDIVDLRCVCDRTALSKAAENGHIELVQLLLKHRASPTEENMFAEDAMMLAQRNGHDDVTDLLISYAIPDEKDIIDDCMEHFQNFVTEKNFEGLFVPKTVEEMAKNAASKMLALQKMGWEEGFALELALLAFFDIVVLVDNSATIKLKERGTRRSQAEQTLKTIARIFTLMTDRKLSTVTLMNREYSWNNVGTEDIERIMNRQNFHGETHTDEALQGKVLKHVEEDNMSRPVLILTLSDFKTSKPGGPERLKKGITEYLSKLGCPTSMWMLLTSDIGVSANIISSPQQVAAFQFVQVGSEAHRFFKELKGSPGVGKSWVYPVGGLDFDRITKDIESNERRRIMKNIMIGSIVDAYYNQGEEAEDENLKERDTQREERKEKEEQRQKQILKDKEERLKAKEAEIAEKKKREDDEFQERERKKYEENCYEDSRYSYEKQQQHREFTSGWGQLRTDGYEQPANWYRALEVVKAASSSQLPMQLVVDKILGTWDKDILLNSASNGWVDDVRFLLDCKVDINQTGRKRRTALHLAARHGHGHVVRILLERGANYMLKDKSGNTPLDLAKMHEKFEASNLLESWAL